MDDDQIRFKSEIPQKIAQKKDELVDSEKS